MPAQKPNLNELQFPFFPVFVLALAFVLLIFSISPYYQRQEPILPVNYSPQARITPTILPTPQLSPSNSIFCGGIAAIQCPKNYQCQLDGNYPDAGGHCILVGPKATPTTKPSSSKKYVCPTSEWVDCMPHPDADPNPECRPDYLKWASINCPGFKGAAL